MTTGKLPDQSTWHEVATTGDKSLAQIPAANSMDVSAMLRATACHYGFFDAVTKDHLDSIFNETLAATLECAGRGGTMGAEPALVAHAAPPIP